MWQPNIYTIMWFSNHFLFALIFVSIFTLSWFLSRILGKCIYFYSKYIWGVCFKFTKFILRNNISWNIKMWIYVFRKVMFDYHYNITLNFNNKDVCSYTWTYLHLHENLILILFIGKLFLFSETSYILE